MKALIKSFGYAISGILRTIKTERNMRIHLTVTAYMFGYLFIYDFFEISRTDMALLFIMCALVMSGELVNTAIENLADRIEKDKNIFIRNAKDAASGAVLVSAVFSVAVGIAVMWQPRAFLALFDYYKENPIMLLILALSGVLSCIFIFKPFGKNKKDPKGTSHD